jgi:hypothetical protein
MNGLLGAAIATVLAASTAANAAMTLQFDVNGIQVQAQNSNGQNSAFGGLTHTGSVNFSFAPNITRLVDVAISNNNGAFVSQGFNGSLVNFTGQINMTNGQVTGGSINIQINGNDAYSAQVVSNVGSVSTFVGGGYKIEGLTFNGLFSDSTFGNVDVAPWFNQQLSGLMGSFLQFNFSPNATGFAYSDMDVFVNAEVVPLPPAAWTGLATISGLMTLGYVRRRRG